MELIPKLKYGIIKTFGTGRFMKLKNDIAKRQRSYYAQHEKEITELQSFLTKIKENPIDESEENKAEVLLQNADMQGYMLKMREIQLEQMEYMLSPPIVDELCALVEKIGQLCTIEDVKVMDLDIDAIISLGFLIVRLDDAKSDAESEEKKKIIE